MPSKQVAQARHERISARHPLRVGLKFCVLEAALEYANRGWPVFQTFIQDEKLLPASAAKDGGPRWDATTDPEEIKRRWTIKPNAGVGSPQVGLGVLFLGERMKLEALIGFAIMGVGVRLLAALAGHSHISTTQRYIDVNADQMRDTASFVALRTFGQGAANGKLEPL